ncbi:MAG: prepilin-type N-terminal cleavage/methylation domain-containing protein [Nitrospirota bacterium]
MKNQRAEYLSAIANIKTGFTLIEVMVAIAILAIGIVTVMQLFSGGLRSGKAANDYTQAVIYAKGKMEEMLINPVSGSGESSEGSDFDNKNNFRWEAEIQDASETSQLTEGTSLKLLKIRVKVLWNESDKQRTVELVSMKAVTEDAK